MNPSTTLRRLLPLAAFLGCLTLVDAFAAPGDVDNTFQATLGGFSNNAISLQPDGAMIVAGRPVEETGGGLTRLLPDGSADTLFQPLDELKASSLTASSFTGSFIQSDGKILSTGSFYDSDENAIPPLLRFHKDGRLDETFVPEDGVGVFKLLPNGKLLVGKWRFVNYSGVGYNLLRLNPDGSVDPTFVAAEFENKLDCVEVLDDGRILAGGSFFDYAGSSRDNLVRLHPDGALDTGFDASAINGVTAVVVQPDGKLLVRPYSAAPNRCLIRLLENGAEDPGFAVTAGTLSAFQLQTDGKIVIAGQFTTVNGVNRVGLARITSTGVLDTTFTATGLDSFYDGTLVIQADGRILTASNAFPLRRRLNDPAFSSFSMDVGTLRWLRSGAGPEIGHVTFDQWDATTDQWLPLLTPSRIAGGWSIPSSGLPVNGVVRARGLPRTSDFGVGAVEELFAFGNATPTLEVADAAGTTLSSGATVDMGRVMTGHSGALTFRLRNLGPGVLDPASVTLSGPFSSKFSVVEYLPSAVGPGGEKTFVVRFSPTFTGAGAATLTISSNAPGGNFLLNVTATSTTVFSPVFNSADEIPLTTAAFDASGKTFGTMTLGFAPTPGTILTLVQMTGNGEIANRLSDLPEGTRVTAEFGGQTYTFLVGYHGGPRTHSFKGNDLTLALVGAGTPRSDFAPILEEIPENIAVTTAGTLVLYPRNNPFLVAPDGTPIITSIDLDRSHVVACPDGGFLVGGYFTEVEGLPIPSLVRFDSWGKIDTSFVTDLTGDHVYGVAVQTDGKILVSGGNDSGAVSRFLPDGSRDTSFSYNLGGLSGPITLLANGKLLVAGNIEIPGGQIKTLVRLMPDGAFDPTFDYTHSNSNAQVGATVEQVDGKLVFVDGDGSSARRLRRLNPDGSYDTTFEPKFGRDGDFSALTVQADGKFVVGGSFNTVNGIPRSSLVRFNVDGSVDPTFTSDCSRVYFLAPFPNGELLTNGGIVGGVSYPGLARLMNDPGELLLEVPDSTRVRLMTNGAAPAVNGVTFDLLPSGATEWTRLADPARIAGGWEIAGQSLPVSGVIRWRARPVTSASSSVALEGFLNFGAAAPDIVLRDIDGAVLTSGTGGIDFGTMLTGRTRTLTVSVENQGDGVWEDVAALISGADAANFSVLSVPHLPLMPGETVEFTVRFMPTADGTKSASLSLTSNDPAHSPFVIPLAGQGGNVLSPTFHSREDTIITADSFTASGLNFGTLSLAFAPTDGTKLMVVMNTGNGAISGFFDDLPDGSLVSAEFSGTTYQFLVGYSGGSSNDLTLSLIGPGVRDLAWTSAIGRGPVNVAVPLTDGKTLIGGDFLKAGGFASIYLARLNPNGAIDPTFTLAPNGNVNAIHVFPDGGFLLAGNFTAISGLPAYRVAKVRPDGTLDRGFYAQVEGNPVNTLAVQPDGKILVGGRFTLVDGGLRGRLVRLNPDGSWDSSFVATPNSTVTCIKPLPDGRILIGGSFTGFTGATGPDCLARLLADGSLDPTFTPVLEDSYSGSGIVNAIHVQQDGKIVAGGKFNKVNGESLTGLARLLTDGTTDPTFAATSNGDVSAIAAQNDGKLLFSGTFTTVNGVSRNGLARIGPDGALDPVITTDFYGLPTSIALQADGKILATGSFYRTNGTSAPALTRLLNGPASSTLTADGPSALIWSCGETFPDEATSILEIHGFGESGWRELGTGQRIAGGWRLDGLSLPADALFRVRSVIRTTSAGYPLLTALSPIGNAVAGIVVSDSAGNLLANPGTARDFGKISGGLVADLRFTLANSGTVPLEGISFAVTGAGAGDFSVIPPSTTLLPAGNTVQFGIRFIPHGSSPSQAELQITSTNPGVGTFVIPLAGTGGDVFAPVFLNPSDQSAIGTNFFLGSNTFGGLTLGFVPPVGSSLMGIQKIIAGDISSAFSNLPDLSVVTASFGGNSYSFIATYRGGDGNDLTFVRVGPSVADPVFRPMPAPGVSSIGVQPNGKLVIGGDFTSLGGITKNRLARLFPNGAADPIFPVSAPAKPLALATQRDGKVIVCNTVTATDGTTRSKLARLHADGTLDTTFSPAITGTVYRALELRSGRILLAGQFTKVGTAFVSNLARLNADGSYDAAFSAAATSGTTVTVQTMAEQEDGKIVVGGSFQRINGITKRYITRVDSSGVLDTSFNSSIAGITAAQLDVSALVIQRDGKIVVSGNFSSVEAVRQLRIARLLPDGSPDHGFHAALDFPAASLTLQADGGLLVAGRFTYVNGESRLGVVRLLSDGSLDSAFRPGFASGYVDAAVMENDGSVLVGGLFKPLAGVGGENLARLTGGPGISELAVSGPGSVRWDRSGALPEIGDAKLEISTDEGATWSAPVGGSRTPTGWTFGSLALPSSGYLRVSGLTIAAPTSSAMIRQIEGFGISSFDDWRSAKFGFPLPPESSALSDPDHDGFANLMEFSMGLDPWSDSSTDAPTWQTVGGDHIIEFPRPAGVAGIIYRGEWSEDLASGSWQPAEDLSTGGMLRFKVVPNGKVRLFFRLAVNEEH
ncbi:MAG: choice-of-anchor D domain-containing protein [Verrucomicrobiota bacterium]